MTFAADSPLAGKVVESPSSERGARTNGVKDIRAIVIHHAEGGGTVSWLTRADGNSSHYVVEYTGRIVQMVPERQWAGSLNPKTLRTGNDAYFTFLGERLRYGRGEARRALGGDTYYQNPNRYVIAIEVEGFAKAGPNANQRTALKRLVADIRKRRGWKPALGHRDFQAYKACPGKKIPWVDYGGHATTEPATVEPPAEDDVDLSDFSVFAVPREVTVPAGTRLYTDLTFNEATSIVVSPERVMPVSGKFGSGPLLIGVTPDDGTEPRTLPWRVVRAKDVSGRDIVAEPADCADAVKVERTRAQGIAANAINTLGGI